MVRALRIVRKARQALKNADLLEILRSELPVKQNNSSSSPYRILFKGWHGKWAILKASILEKHPFGGQWKKNLLHWDTTHQDNVTWGPSENKYPLGLS